MSAKGEGRTHSIQAYLGAQLYGASREPHSLLGTSPTFEQLLALPTRRVHISHAPGLGQERVSLGSKRDIERWGETGLSNELTNVLRSLRAVTGRDAVDLTRDLLVRSERYKEGYFRWQDMRELEPAMLGGLQVFDDVKKNWVFFRSGLVAYTVLNPGMREPQDRVNSLIETVGPHYTHLSEALRAETGFHNPDITKLLLEREPRKLFAGLRIVDDEVRAILMELRGKNYMDERGAVLHDLLGKRGGEGRKITYTYDPQTDTLSQEYSIQVPNIIVSPGIHFEPADEKKRKITTFLRRFGIFCHPFFQAALAVEGEMWA